MLLYTTWRPIVEAERVGHEIVTRRLARQKLHTYETPAIMVMPIEQVDPDYHRWIVEETSR